MHKINSLAENVFNIQHEGIYKIHRLPKNSKDKFTSKKLGYNTRDEGVTVPQEVMRVISVGTLRSNFNKFTS